MHCPSPEAEDTDTGVRLRVFTALRPQQLCDPGEPQFTHLCHGDRHCEVSKDCAREEMESGLQQTLEKSCLVFTTVG